MDNCGATNKSQFCFGGLALLLMLGYLDAFCIFFMVVGHTKFEPDDLARAIAGAYQRGDSFNFAMFMKHVISCATGEAYDGSEVLRDFRAASELLFRSVDKIMSHRVFIMVGDDGLFDLGVPETLPLGMEPLILSGPVYKRATLEKQIELLKERSLVPVMLDVLEETFRGIGSGSGDYGPAPARLLPGSATAFRNVRLFCAAKETDIYVVEQVGWFKLSKKSKADGLEAVNNALLLLKPYSEVDGKMKEPYGPRKEQLRIMHGRYVPQWYVPDIFAVGLAQSNTLRQRIIERGQTGVRLAAARGVPGSNDSGPSGPLVTRYNQANHDGPLIAILSQSKYKTMRTSRRKLGHKEWKEIANVMPCQQGYIFTPASIKAASQRLIKARKV